MNILLVDDEESSRLEVAAFLRSWGHTVIEKDNAHEALAVLQSETIHLILTDYILPMMSGMDFLRKIKELPHGSELDVVIVTAHGDIQTVIEAVRAGTSDYLLKPVKISELMAVINRSAEHLASKQAKQVLSGLGVPEEQTGQQLFRLREAYAKQIGLKSIGFFSESIKNILKLAWQLHEDPSVPVLIEGETGTGKEVIARIIHYGEGDVNTPFIAINCAAIPPTVFESELFGYEGGSFTGGLSKGQKGKLDLAYGGTLFLDEITEIPVELQAKLLRVIQEKEYFRVGGLKMINTNVRIIGATNHNIETMVVQGAFRRDLFYRLNVGRIHLPPLRERKESILPLAKLFLSEFARERGKEFKSISKEAAHILLSYEWPGNIREMRNVIQRVVLTADDDQLKDYHLAFLNRNKMVDATQAGQNIYNPDFNAMELPRGSLQIEEWYDNIICRALEMHNGNKTETAKYLGISRNSLSYRLKKIMK